MQALFVSLLSLSLSGLANVQPLPLPLPLAAPEEVAEPDEVRITLQADAQPLGSVLREIARQAKWDVVINAPEEQLAQPVTLHVTQRPADDVVELLADQSELDIEVDEGMLSISSGRGHRHDHGDDDEDEDEGEEEEEEGDSESGQLRLNVDFDDDDSVVMGQDLIIEPGKRVRDAVSMGGDVIVQGRVDGDVVATGGDVVLEAGARVDGDAVAVGGDVTVEPGAKLGGNRVSLGGSMGGVIAALAQHDASEVAWIWGVASTLFRGLALLAIGLVLIALAPERMRRLGLAVLDRPLRAAGLGLGMLIVLPPLCVLLAVTIVGIPLIPIVGIAFAALVATGLAALALLLGDRLPLLPGKGPFLALLIGVVLILLVDFIPVLGTLVVFTAGLIGAGAVIMSRFGDPSRSGPPQDPTPATDPTSDASQDEASSDAVPL